MNISQLVELIKSSDSRTGEAMIMNALTNFWELGWRKRDHMAKKMKGFSQRQLRRYESEMEILIEKYSRMGYSGVKLEELIHKEMLLDEKIV